MNDSLVQIVLIVLASQAGLFGLLAVMAKLEPGTTHDTPVRRRPPAR